VIILLFSAATHILRVNGAEIADDGRGQPAYDDIFSIKRTFFIESKNLSLDLLNSKSLP